MQLLFYLPFAMMRRQSLLGVPGERVMLLTRGFIGFMAFTLSYVAVRMIPLGDVATIVFSAPIYVSIFACICLSESCGLFQVVTIGMTIAGTLLIAKPTFLFSESGEREPVDVVHLRTEGTVIAFAASLLVSLTFIVMRRLRKSSTPVIIAVFSAECVLFGSLSLLVLHCCFKEQAGQFSKGIGVPDTWTEIMWLGLNGVCGVLGLLCMTIGMKIEEAGLMSLVRSIDIVCAFLLQIAFLPDESVHWTSLLGAAVVVSSLIVSGLRRYLKDKPGSCDTLWLLLTCGEERMEEKEVFFVEDNKKNKKKKNSSLKTLAAPDKPADPNGNSGCHHQAMLPIVSLS